MAKRTKTDNQKRNATGSRDLSPKTRKTREVSGGVLSPAATIQPRSLGTRNGGEVISSDAY